MIRCEYTLPYDLPYPLPYDTKISILLNSNHCLAELIVVDFHTKLYHISIKQNLTEVRHKFWMLKGRNFIRKTLRKCIARKKFNSKSYQYPTTPPLTKFHMCDNYSFYTTGVDNFGPLFVKSMFSSDSSTKHKMWVTLHTCASSRALLLDVVPSKSSSDFIKSFKRFFSQRGIPNNVILDDDSNFASVESQEFINGLDDIGSQICRCRRGMEDFFNAWLEIQNNYCRKC